MRAKRWEDFKERRRMIVDQYLARKKVKLRAEEILKILFMVQIIHISAQRLIDEQNYRQLQIRKNFMKNIV
jgi:hypothetical protein